MSQNPHSKLAKAADEDGGTKQSSFLSFLRKMSKKGFFQIFVFISERGEVHYNDVMKYAMSSKIVNSRASVTIALNALTDLDVLDRTVSAQRPVRTTYRLNKKGRAVLQHLKEISKEL